MARQVLLNTHAFHFCAPAPFSAPASLVFQKYLLMSAVQAPLLDYACTPSYPSLMIPPHVADGDSANKAALWLYLLNMTTDDPTHTALPPRLVCMPGSSAKAHNEVAKWSNIANSATGEQATLRVMNTTQSAVDFGTFIRALHPERISTSHPEGFGPGIDWILCGINCHDARLRCGAPWGSEFRDLMRRL